MGRVSPVIWGGERGTRSSASTQPSVFDAGRVVVVLPAWCSVVAVQRRLDGSVAWQFKFERLFVTRIGIASTDGRMLLRHRAAVEVYRFLQLRAAWILGAVTCSRVHR